MIGCPLCILWPSSQGMALLHSEILTFPRHLARLWGSWGVPFCVPKVWIISLCLLKLSRDSLRVTLHDFGAHGESRFVFLRFGFSPLLFSRLSRDSLRVTLHDFGAHGESRFVFLRFGFLPLLFSRLSRDSRGHLARLWGSWCAPLCVPKVSIHVISGSTVAKPLSKSEPRPNNGNGGDCPAHFRG